MRPLSPVARASSVKCRADDGRDDLVEIGQALDRVGEGLLVDLGVFGADPVADCAVAIAANSRFMDLHRGAAPFGEWFST